MIEQLSSSIRGLAAPAVVDDDNGRDEEEEEADEGVAEARCCCCCCCCCCCWVRAMLVVAMGACFSASRAVSASTRSWIWRCMVMLCFWMAVAFLVSSLRSCLSVASLSSISACSFRCRSRRFCCDFWLLLRLLSLASSRENCGVRAISSLHPTLSGKREREREKKKKEREIREREKRKEKRKERERKEKRKEREKKREKRNTHTHT